MRPAALIVRAGAVVLAVGFLFALLIDGAPQPVTEQVQAAPEQAEAVKTPAVTKKPARKGPAGVVSIVATGDIVMGSTPNLPPDGGRSFFNGVKSDLAGDVVLGNLEGTLSTGGRSKCGSGSSNCYAFQTPPSYAAWLKKAGFTMMNVANNHAYDFGASGQKQTLAALATQRLASTGRPGQIAYEQVGDIEVAVVGFAPYPWAQSLTDIPAARRLVEKAAGKADVVIVSMHGGAEGTDHTHVSPGTETYLGENRGNLVAFSHAVVDAGADVVIGHGPHVLRGMEWYKGRLIAYSLGNFAGYKVFALGGQLSLSGILRVTLTGNGEFESATLVPTRLVRAGVPALDPAESAHGIVRTLSRQDFGRRGVKISANGNITR